MPWIERKPMDEKLLLIADYLRQSADFATLCRRYGVSRKTGYKWVARYRDQGLPGLDERSRRPKVLPAQVPLIVRQAIIDLRGRCGMEQGPKKIQAVLRQRFPDQPVPCRTTIYNVLKQAGLVVPRSQRRRVTPAPGLLRPANTPNVLWSADFKGQFLMGNGQWCFPLTVMDHASRYLLGCQALPAVRQTESQAVFERLFREFGLPDRLRTDNGVPFASLGAAGLSRLSIWWIRLGIQPERITPGRPQQNGRHERMHRTLKRAVIQPPAQDAQAQQKRFERFCSEYNTQRPHEALGQRPPASVYAPSPRSFPRQLPEMLYPSTLHRHRVSSSGLIYWRRLRIYIGGVLAGQHIGLDAIADGVWDAYFGTVHLGRFDETTLKPGNDYLTLQKCHPCL